MTFHGVAHEASFYAITPAKIVVLVLYVVPVPVIERNRLAAVPADPSVMVEYLCASLAFIKAVEQIVAIVTPIAALVLELPLVGRTAISAEATHAPACLLRRLENF